MSNTVYPYRIEYERTPKWYENDWRELAEWCNQCIGPGNWEYYFGEFVFTNEADYMLFKLKWI